MKFARYLEETQVPEWKKAYIDYRGLKKHINAIRFAQENEANTPPRPVSPVVNGQEVATHIEHDESGHRHSLSPRVSFAALEPEPSSDDENAVDHEGDKVAVTSGSMPLRILEQFKAPITESPESIHTSTQGHEGGEGSGAGEAVERPAHPRLQAHFPSSASSTHSISSKISHHAGISHEGVLRSATLNMGFLPRLRRRSTTRSLWEPSRRATKNLQWDLAKSIPLKDLLPMLTVVQQSFFQKLDSELDKVETFYVEREKEMHARCNTLRAQLKELKDHGRAFYQSHNDTYSWIPSLIRRRPAITQQATETQTRKRRSFKADTGSPSRHAAQQKSPTDENKALENEIENVNSVAMQGQDSGDASETANGSGSGGSEGEERRSWKIKQPFQRHNIAKTTSPTIGGILTRRHEPEDYLHARKALKKAVLECYRGLEVLENYRTLNVIGFRKALKKFEKYTKIPAQQAYFLEKIEPSAFSSGAAVQAMLSEMENLYAARFTRGDPKLAKTRLRGQAQQKTHHFSTFRTGLLIGVAIPALVDGIYLSFQADTRRAMPGYGGLLFVYSIFLIPVVFSFLVGLNILVWSRSRINYVFIFELDVKTRLDHREYFEIPALLFSTLCYALWLSFARIGSHHFSPVLWPLIWLAFAAVTMLDPLPVLFKTSRWWLIRNISRLLTSGMHRVEFADFWMGDQFCSLVFTLSNLYFVACAYTRNFDSDWEQCTRNRIWGVPFVLAILPFVVRLVQSIKRWFDSGLGTHLINGGKYGAGIVYYLFYFIWRHQGGGRGAIFALWCIFGTIYAIYASAWDLLMDWSVLRPHVNHPLLRSELLYTGYIPLYYFAIVTNILIRFIWVFYIPENGPNILLRTWIGGMLEMLRRVQWNFIRLENEHLGNMDQYRVTREVPLPYSFDDAAHDSDGDEDDHKSLSSWRKRNSKQNMSPPEDVLTGGSRDGLSLRQSRQ